MEDFHRRGQHVTVLDGAGTRDRLAAVYLQAGRVYLDDGRPGEALRCYERAAERYAAAQSIPAERRPAVVYGAERR